MNKVLCASISALLITGSLSAFAAAATYTDLDSGLAGASTALQINRIKMKLP